MKFPNIWGEGSLFAYSGIDGPTDWYHPFVGSLMADKLGITFHTENKRSLWCGEAMRQMNLCCNIVVSDFIDITLFSKNGHKKGNIWFVFIDKDVVVGKTLRTYLPNTGTANSCNLERDLNQIIQSSDGEHTVLIWKEFGDIIKFAYAFDSVSKVNAVAKAKRGLISNLDKEREKRWLFFERLPGLQFPDEMSERTYYKAFSVLKVNVESPQGDIKYMWSTPDRIPHRRMFLWDSVFHALAYKYISSTLAEEALKAVLAKQKDNGFIPHMMGPDLDSNVTQPPLLAWGVWNVYQYSKNIDFLRYAYPKLKSYVWWDIKNRNLNGTGLLCWQKDENNLKCRCGESGMDNSPRFDFKGPDDAIDFSSFIANEMEYLENIAKILKIDKDVIMWKRVRNQIKKLITKNLWDKHTSFFYDRNSNGEFVRVKTPASFMPLFAGVASNEQASSLVKHLINEKEFWRPFPVPSVSADELSFSDDMWRGPTWVNYNYLIIQGLKRYVYNDVAVQITQKTINEIKRWYDKTGVIFEFYDSEGKTPPSLLHRKGGIGGKGGTGFGVIKDYNWTAAVYILLHMEEEFIK